YGFGIKCHKFWCVSVLALAFTPFS
ncbi:hypothetical protein VCHENC01_3636B, partial [Vibrio harveyi]